MRFESRFAMRFDNFTRFDVQGFDSSYFSIRDLPITDFIIIIAVVVSSSSSSSLALLLEYSSGAVLSRPSSPVSERIFHRVTTAGLMSSHNFQGLCCIIKTSRQIKISTKTSAVADKPRDTFVTSTKSSRRCHRHTSQVQFLSILTFSNQITVLSILHIMTKCHNTNLTVTRRVRPPNGGRLHEPPFYC